MWDNAYFSNMVRSISCQLMFLMVRLELARYTSRPQNVMTGEGIAMVAPKSPDARPCFGNQCLKCLCHTFYP